MSSISKSCASNYFLQDVRLLRKNGEEVFVNITVRDGVSEGGKVYAVWNAKADLQGDFAKLGQMTLKFDSRTYKDPVTEQKVATKYVYVERLDNYTYDKEKEKIQGIGMLLLRCAFAYSLACQREGNLEVDASGDSHFFYFTKGFVPHPCFDKAVNGVALGFIYEKIREGKELSKTQLELIESVKTIVAEQKKIAREVVTEDEIFFYSLKERMSEKLAKANEKNKPASIKWFGSLIMHLPEEQLAIWKKDLDPKIEQAEKTLQK